MFASDAARPTKRSRLGAALLVLACAAPAFAQSTQPTPAPGAGFGPGSGAISHDRSRRITPVVEVFNRCKDAVVNISSTQVIKVQSPFGADNLFDQFLDMPGLAPQEYRATSVGTGFVIHPSGYIVTNAHVVAKTIDRKVIFADKREFDAQDVAIDPQRDLAILQIDAGDPLPTVYLGRSADLMVGETVVAIGNPLGFQHTVTSGVVSALNRTLELENNVSFKGLIQTDASINPGNSGGPLLNVNAELIGINTAIRNDAQNIGFAIPVDTLREVLPELLDVERRYGFLTGAKVRDGVGPDGNDACVVAKVIANSPADKAGLVAGDVLQQLNGQLLRGAIDFQIALIGKKSGDTLSFTVVPGRPAPVPAGTAPATTAPAGPRQVSLALANRPRPDGAKLLKSRFGIEAKPLDPKQARDIGIRPIKALYVTDVEPKSPADVIGLKPGDIIDRINSYQAGSLSDVGEMLEKIESGQAFVIGVIRLSGRTLYRASVNIAARVPPPV